MNNGTTAEVISQFDKISKLKDVWDHNQHYQKYLLSAINDCDLALDIGCGTGEFSRELSKYAKIVIGIDVSKEMVDRAIALTNNSSTKYYCIDFDTYFNQTDENYDLIVCIAALHHMDERNALLKMKQKLNMNGIICIIDLYQNDTIKDYLISIIASIINPIMMLIKRGRISVTKEEREAWKYHFQYDKYKTIKEIKDIARNTFGKYEFKQHLFWRYSIIYKKT